MKVGDLVALTCDNQFLDGKIGTIVLAEEDEGSIYGLCVLIQGLVYGFKPSEVKVIN